MKARNLFGLWSEKEAQFERVPHAEDEELLADSERSSVETHAPIISQRRPTWFATAILLIATSLVSATIGVWGGRYWILDSDNISIQHTSSWSPIIQDVGITYSRVRFNGSLLKSNVFRQDAGPEVDAAWKSLGADFHAARIPADQAARSGLAHDQVKIKEKYGGGYPANVEGLHHLHCLNLLRKSLAWNFNYYQAQGLGPFSNDATILKYHVTHCLDIIRQQLMCTVDVGVLGQVWYQPPGKAPEAFVDFNTMHTCRNFEQIRDWAETHQLPTVDDIPADFLEQPAEGDKIYQTVP